MRFIHTADLHLGSPFLGLKEMPIPLWEKVKTATQQALEEMVSTAISKRVDFFIISGDVYDSDHPSIQAVDFFIRQCQRLVSAKIPVYLVYGNHDHQQVVNATGLPANVHVFNNQVETKYLTLTDQTKVALTGFSYQKRWVEEDIVKHYPHREANVDWQIGLLHGAQQQQDQHYAPFQLAELATKNYDYWALGHIHHHQLVEDNPLAVYPGSLQGQQPNEDGSHGFYLVESQGHQLVTQFVPVAPIEWHTLGIAAPKTGDLIEFEQEVSQQVTAKLSSDKFCLVHLHLTGKLDSHLQRLALSGDLLAHIQDQRRDLKQWWPYQLTISSGKKLPALTDFDQKYWDQAAQEIFTSEQIIASAAGLTREKFIADELTKVDPAVIRQQVIDLITGREQQDED